MAIKILLVILFAVYSVNGNDLPKEFTDLLDRGNLIFTAPEDLDLVPILKDTLTEHNIRYFSEQDNIELKIQIIPLDTTDKYPNPKIFMVSKKGTYEDINISSEFFNCSKAALAEFELIEGIYDNKFKHCVIVWIHKNKQAGVYICLTGNDKTKMLEFGKKYLFNKNKVILKFKD